MSKKLLLSILFLGLALMACAPKALYLLDITEPVIPPDTPQRPWIMVGSKNWGSSKLYQKFCVQGQFREILKAAKLPAKNQKALWEAACGPRASSTLFVKAYYELDDEWRIRLRETLENHGYILNEFPC